MKDVIPVDAKLVCKLTGRVGMVMNSWFDDYWNDVIYEIEWEDPNDIQFLSHSNVLVSNIKIL